MFKCYIFLPPKIYVSSHFGYVSLIMESFLPFSEKKTTTTISQSLKTFTLSVKNTDHHVSSWPSHSR